MNQDWSTTTIDILRHGEPVGGQKYRGQSDDPLSETGWRQMREAVGDACPWQHIVSSPLQRCHAFAAELAQRHKLPLQLEPDFMEIGFGAWEGFTAKQLMQRDPEILLRFWADPVNETPPGGEPLAAFRERVVPAWERQLALYRGQHLLIVGHAGMMRMIMSHILEIPLSNLFRVQIPNAAMIRVLVEGDGQQDLPRIVFHSGGL